MNEIIHMGWLHFGQHNGKISKILAKGPAGTLPGAVWKWEGMAHRNRLALLGCFLSLGLSCISTFQKFVVKGQEFSLFDFLQSRADSNRYAAGAMAIVRLCPSDYHRFHFPCDGTPTPARLINGPLYSVNPMALRKRLSILAENKTFQFKIISLKTPHF